MRVKLLVVQGKPAGKSLVFPVGEYVFGRGAECHIRPNSDWVSRQHCMLRVTPDAVFVRDLGSRNGTLVNGVRLLGERRLGPGDQLQVGPLVFELQPHEAAAQSAPSRPAPTVEIAAHGIDTAEMPNAATAAELPVAAPEKAPEEAPAQPPAA
jgi:pSer/pThr/pTyr-binding forkhead associated (FHA) protein